MGILNDIGSTELVLIVVIVLLLFGKNKLPELGKGIGEVIREFKKSLSGKKE